MKTDNLSLYNSLTVVLCLILWNLMFYTCSFVCGRHKGTSVPILHVSFFLTFASFSLSYKFQLPHFPKLSFLSLSQLSKTASCSIVLMVLPCRRKCDQSMPISSVCSLLQSRVLHCMLSNNNCLCIFSGCLVVYDRRIFSVNSVMTKSGTL